ncbi:MAG: iron-sulfur cluster-binding protein [Alphaproteobacteria bacterium]|nr:MAG: iron-sulfur cluster-binding protein [Alphaproteobacteria bacterium]
MEVTSNQFKQEASKALRNPVLQKALGHIEEGFVEARNQAARRLPEFEQMRDRARDIKAHAIDNLGFYLSQFEDQVIAQGGQVHWAADAQEAREIVAAICLDQGARNIAKSKSMVTEEIELGPYLEAKGLASVETDLGEYIIQLRDEKPSHIIAPIIHLSKEQVSDTFYEHHQKHGYFDKLTERSALVKQARSVLRKSFMNADVGITGANFLVAETGSVVLVTNEGNGDLVTTIPDTHIVVTGIEKVVPTMDDCHTLLRVLVRSATGQDTTSYVSFFTGAKRPGDAAGPSNFHVVLVDNGRSDMVGGVNHDMLRCIRCGACLNHCPVYANIGGHAYGSVYPGPMGAVLTPQLAGVEQAIDLPNASTFCGKCEEVCPVRIPLPSLMRHWREEEFARHLTPKPMRFGLGMWSWLGRQPALYRVVLSMVQRVLGLFAKRGWVKHLPMGTSWTLYRDMKAPKGGSFQQQWRRR